MSKTEKPETWPEYYARMMKEDPHGISPESREVDEATRGYWDGFWRWEDGKPVNGILYFNFGAAQKVARKYGFLLPEQNVENHRRLKEAGEAGKRAFGHEFSWRHNAPRDTVKETVMARKAAENSEKPDKSG